MTKPKVVCITPVKNEEWIIDRFLAATSLWADHIIIADQYSTDKTREICLRYPKVSLIENKNPDFNEPERQKLLIDQARKIKGPKLLLALDADEFLTPEFTNKKEWDQLLSLKPGTVIWFDWLNIHPNFLKYWLAPQKMPLGFMDDGSDHQGNPIHSPRIPMTASSPAFYPKRQKVMHFQYTDWQRMESKHRWYQVWEELNNHKHDPVSLYRMYHHMYSISTKLELLPSEFLKVYQKHGINLTTNPEIKEYWWDKEVLNMIQSSKSNHLAWLDVWDNVLKSHDPRKWYHRLLHLYLRSTQSRSNLGIIQLLDLLLVKSFRAHAKYHFNN